VTHPQNTHTLRHTHTLNGNPLGEWSARRRYLYLTTHNNHNRQTCIFQVGLEPTITNSKRQQTYRKDIGIVINNTIIRYNINSLALRTNYLILLVKLEWNRVTHRTEINNLPTYLFTYLPTYLQTYLNAYLPTYLPTYRQTYLPTYLPIYLLTTYIITTPSTYLPTYLPTLYLLTYLPTPSTYLLPTYLPTPSTYLPTYLKN